MMITKVLIWLCSYNLSVFILYATSLYCQISPAESPLLTLTLAHFNQSSFDQRCLSYESFSTLLHTLLFFSYPISFVHLSVTSVIHLVLHQVLLLHTLSFFDFALPHSVHSPQFAFTLNIHLSYLHVSALIDPCIIGIHYMLVTLNQTILGACYECISFQFSFVILLWSVLVCKYIYLSVIINSIPSS